VSDYSRAKKNDDLPIPARIGAVAKMKVSRSKNISSIDVVEK
jgi:hypothetical protein